MSQQCKDNMFSIQTLKDFQYVDKDGKDQGANGSFSFSLYSYTCCSRYIYVNICTVTAQIFL